MNYYIAKLAHFTLTEIRLCSSIAPSITAFFIKAGDEVALKLGTQIKPWLRLLYFVFGNNTTLIMPLSTQGIACKAGVILAGECLVLS